MDTLLPSITLVNIVLMLMPSVILDPLLSLRVIQITLFLDMDIQDVKEGDNGIHLSASPDVKVKIFKIFLSRNRFKEKVGHTHVISLFV